MKNEIHGSLIHSALILQTKCHHDPLKYSYES
jgi:hypothetical protein